MQEVKVVKARRLGSWGVILARVTEKESTGDYIPHDAVRGREHSGRLQSAHS